MSDILSWNFNNIFEEEQIPIMVVNAQHIKGVPGRKTDVKDAGARI